MINAITNTPDISELGKKSEYDSQYNPEKLFPIPRSINREKIGINGKIPFFGFDIWNHYEVSWLNPKGKPIVGLAELIFTADSEFLIESKSMKLYFNSFNNTHIESPEVLANTIQHDIEKRIGAKVFVKISTMNQFREEKVFRGFEGTCIDDLDIECSSYQINPSFLSSENTIVNENLYSDLLKSNCLVTNQPDWGSVEISYKGYKINHEGLLRYIVSFRNCNEFSETSIERIFTDIMKQCKPEELTVYGRCTRRGGIDINPIRSTQVLSHENLNKRFCRQ